eukprot:TRINITY_DN17031_c0_g1_i1.p1 TRINITY_DN17031_c0_g1~~TRINITY_DN17031_c0_g1_i1.p1  ORF type:complete len:101 (-),score=19.12 TRINITY_DN17031_c0_g1_i1:304-606(-)
MHPCYLNRCKSNPQVLWAGILQCRRSGILSVKATARVTVSASSRAVTSRDGIASERASSFTPLEREFPRSLKKIRFSSSQCCCKSFWSGSVESLFKKFSL